MQGEEINTTINSFAEKEFWNENFGSLK
jgi:hypothetical protein